MTGLWIIFGSLAAATLGLLLLWLVCLGAGREVAAWTSAITGLCVGIAALIFAGLLISLYVERAQCSSWSQQTGRDSKFVFYTPVTWDCLARTPNGTWLPKDQLREFGEDAG